MNITYTRAKNEDIDSIYELIKRLICDYEQLETIDYTKVMNWVRRKIESSIDEYTVIYINDRKAGYYHFYVNDDGQFELDDLYQVAVMGLIKASKTYNSKYGTKFTSYAYPFILGEVIKYINEYRNIKISKDVIYRLPNAISILELEIAVSQTSQYTTIS